jgi:hypothetical protein
MRIADQLIDRIVRTSNLPSAKQRRELQLELRAHMEDFVEAAREAGHNEAEIEQLVLTNFGDPGQIAREFAFVYRDERRRVQAVAFTFATVLLASCLLAAILIMQTGLAFGFGTPIMEVLASRHTVIEARDILASVAAYLALISLECLFTSHRFPKAAVLLAVILTVPIAPCVAAGLHVSFLIFGFVNALFSRAIQLFVTKKIIRAGIVVICFSLAGYVSALRWSPGSNAALAATCASWLAMGAGYQLMTHLAARVNTVLLKGELQ